MELKTLKYVIKIQLFSSFPYVNAEMYLANLIWKRPAVFSISTKNYVSICLSHDVFWLQVHAEDTSYV